MDRSLKERLIGASVLVGLAVWLVPWVLDGPVPDAEFEAPRAPTADGSAPIRTQTIRLDNPRDASTSSAVPDIPSSVGSAVSEVVGEVAAVVGEVAAVGSSDTQPEVRAATAAMRSEEISTQVGSGWLVQVGSFGDEENARREAGRLTDLGYEARLYPHRSANGLMYRVRVGPEASRDGADKVASALLDRGFVGTHVVSGE